MTERYKIDMESTRVDITDPWGCVLTLYDGAHATTAGALRQQQEDIDMLRNTVRMLEQYKSDALRAIVERDQLRAKLAEYEQAPTVATIKSWTQGSYFRNYNVQWGDVNIGTGTELIARPK